MQMEGLKQGQESSPDQHTWCAFTNQYTELSRACKLKIGNSVASLRHDTIWSSYYLLVSTFTFLPCASVVHFAFNLRFKGAICHLWSPLLSARKIASAIMTVISFIPRLIPDHPGSESLFILRQVYVSG